MRVGCEVKDAHNLYWPFVLTWKLVLNRTTHRSWRAAASIPVIVAITPRTETPAVSLRKNVNRRQLKFSSD